MQEMKIKKQVTKGGLVLLTPEHFDDNYLAQLVSYLFEHRDDIPYVLKILSDQTIKSYGGNLIYSRMFGMTVFIYDYYDENPEKTGIGINRADLIEIMKAWLKINELIDTQGGIEEMVLQRDEEHINMIAHYEDGSEFKQMFNYKCNEEELKALKEYYFEE